MNIYERIFDRLEELHMSQIELSRRTGIATSTISDWRKKKINPQADKLVAICKALDMSLVDLLCDEDDKKNKVLTSEYVTDKAEFPDYNKKHGSKAKFDWYRYTTRFEIPVYNDEGICDKKEYVFKGNIYLIAYILKAKIYIQNIGQKMLLF